MHSIFERLIVDSQCSRTVLNEQFRMHPTIFDTVLLNFYRMRISSPLGTAKFETSYNSINGNADGFEPFTMLDIRFCLRRIEGNNGRGKTSNRVEVCATQSALETLLRVVCSETLIGYICILAPYSSQVAEVKEHMDSMAHLRGLKIAIDSIDSMQGQEHSWSFFSLRVPV